MTERIVRAGSRKSKPVKPEKPYPDFPLTPHPSGKWCKKVRGKLHYFGTWDDSDGALQEWMAKRDQIQVGIDPNASNEGHDIDWLVNDFLESKNQQLENGDLTKAAFDVYFKACTRIAKFFGKTRLLSTIDSPDFKRFRGTFPKTWSPATVNNNIARISAVFNYAYEVGAVDRPVRKGPNFKRVSKKKQRLERAKKPPKKFEAAELHTLMDAADVQMKAMIFLGINAGFGNADCGRLKTWMIDFDKSWIEGLRPKTAIERSAWLWPETIAAINDAIDNKYPHAPQSLVDNVFMTKRRQSWHKEEANGDPISTAFNRLAKKAGCYRVGVGFYALRHTFETIAGNSKDQIAVNYVMGHSDDSMAEVYREGIDPKRIIDVCSFVRDWWIAGSATTKGASDE